MRQQAFGIVHSRDNQILIGRSLENRLVKDVKARFGQVYLLRHVPYRPILVEVGEDAVAQHLEVHLRLVIDVEVVFRFVLVAVDKPEKYRHVRQHDFLAVLFRAEQLAFHRLYDVGDETAVFRIVNRVGFKPRSRDKVESVLAVEVKPIVHEVGVGRIEVVRNVLADDNHGVGLGEYRFAVHQHVHGLPKMQKCVFVHAVSAVKIKAFLFRPGVAYSADFHCLPSKAVHLLTFYHA